MLHSMDSYSLLVILGLAAASVLLLLYASVQIWRSYAGPQARSIARRLQTLSAGRDQSAQSLLVKERLFSQVPRLAQWLLRVPRAHQVDRRLVQGGLGWSVSQLLLLCLALGLATLLLGQLLHLGLAPTLCLSALAGSLPALYLGWRRRQRLQRFEKQLPEALDLIVRALRAGHSFASALQMVGQELPDPVGREFNIVHDEVNFGVAFQQALTNLTERVPLTDLRYFVVAVLIQRDSGGNLTELLANISRLIRERLKLIAKVRVLSSDGRLSAWVLSLMPFGLAALMNAFNPEFMTPLWTDPMGVTMLQYLLSMMVIGIVVMLRIIKIRV